MILRGLLLAGTQLNGLCLLINAPSTQQTIATSYTINLATGSGPANTGVLCTLSPVGGAWPVGETITLTLAGVSGTLSNPVGAALLGPTLTLTGLSTVSVTITPSAAGAMTISATNSGGLINPLPANYTATSVGGAPAPLSDFTLTQLYPIASDSGDAVQIGYLTPINGEGPFSYKITAGPASFRD